MDERERSIIAAHEVGHAICGKVHGDKRRVEEISPVRPRRGARRHRQQPGGQRPPVRVGPARAARRADGRPRRRGAPVPRGHRRRVERLRDGQPDRDRDGHAAGAWAATPRRPTSGISGRGSLSFLVPTGERSPAVRGPGRGDARDPRRSSTRPTPRRRETLIAQHRARCAGIAAYLVEHERVDGETFDALFEGRLDVPNADEEWRPAASRPREWSTIGAMATSSETPPQ